MESPLKTASQTSEKLPFRTKLIYGLGDWGNTTTATVVGFFFLFFLTDVALLPPAYIVPVMLIGTIWDAVNDPLIGMLADRVRTRWGRRRPFFILGAVPFGLSFFMMWWIPPWDDPLAKMIYYTIVYILYDTAFTAVAVPYTALTPELTKDYDERTSLNGYRMTVSMAGGLIAAITVPIFADLFSEKRTGYLVMAGIFGFLAMLPYILLFFAVKERYPETPRKDIGLLAGFLYTWRNKGFRYVALIYLTSWATVSLVGALLQYYVTYWMQMKDQLEVILGLVQGGALICVPVIVWLAKRRGKQGAYLVGLTWWIFIMLCLTFLMPGSPLVYLLSAGVGLGIAAAHVVPWSMIPDVIEEDELKSGYRREATFYGFMVFLQKIGVALILALIPWVLSLTGYIPPVAVNTGGVVQLVEQAQNETTLTAIRLMVGPLPVVMLSLSMFLAWRYPITRGKYAEIRKALVNKQSGME
jgi:GPH family glycoside/pentoside/hexuronide:cation symporter